MPARHGERCLADCRRAPRSGRFLVRDWVQTERDRQIATDLVDRIADAQIINVGPAIASSVRIAAGRTRSFARLHDRKEGELCRPTVCLALLPVDPEQTEPLATIC